MFPKATLLPYIASLILLVGRGYKAEERAVPL